MRYRNTTLYVVATAFFLGAVAIGIALDHKFPGTADRALSAEVGR